jgi:hypothetical protein
MKVWSFVLIVSACIFIIYYPYNHVDIYVLLLYDYFLLLLYNVSMNYLHFEVAAIIS